MHIKLPDRFENLLSGQYRALIDNSISQFSEILIDNKLEFFQEYTDHGIQHIQKIIDSADNLIDNECFRLLNEKDIAVLLLSILLHDLGMHTKADGLKKLLTGEFDQYRSDIFDQYSWIEAWVNFFNELKRYNDEQILDIFGRTDIILEEPDLDRLNDNDRKLYGEFLRRLHPRLAHEIAIGGFPTRENEPNLELLYDPELKTIIDLAGLIARSHGMNLRATFDYLADRFQDAWRSPLDVKVIFIMVVLRISDYLQIDRSRASPVILSSKRLSSPVSRQEWEKHNAITDLRANTLDPERIYVIAEPNNSKIFIELEKLFSDIQTELDTCWAILGEVYGSDTTLRNLKIKYRRIRSTLDDKTKFSKSVNYLPERVIFDADPELLKLLIGPLYGEDPKYGVRELLQNAVDAVRERKYLHGESKGINIQIQLIEGRYTFTIEDEGIGMTQDILINYFFRAGASFRKSMHWKKDFVTSSGTQVQKTGRFGVGVLAIFLLGDDFELFTKYNSISAQGYYCKASLSSKQIEIQKVNCTIGTRIVVRLKHEIHSYLQKLLEERERGNTTPSLDWFTWYRMDEPIVKIQLEAGLNKLVPFERRLVSSDPEMPSLGWYKLSIKGYRMIHWAINSFDIKSSLTSENNISGELICNGFKIKRKYQITDPSYKWAAPIVSIFDNNGILPLSLNRDYVEDDRLPFEPELLESISTVVIKALLETSFIKKGVHYIATPNNISFGTGHFDLSKFIVVSSESYTLLDPLILLALSVESFYQLWVTNHMSGDTELFVDKNTFYQASTLNYETNYFYKHKMDPYYHDEMRLSKWFNLGHESSFKRKDTFTRIFIKEQKLNYLLVPKKGRLRTNFVRKITHAPVGGGWATIEIQEDSAHKPIAEVDSRSSNINAEALSDSHYLTIERYFENQKSGNSFFINAWLKLLGPNWLIPIDEAKRPPLPLRDKFG